MAPETEILEETPLDRAINTASESTLRAVIRAMCAKHDEARKEAESYLLVKSIDVKTDFKIGDSKIVPRHAFCSACKKEFDVTTNTKESCRYHPRPSEPTGEELWEDNWDEFEVDTDEMREDFPHCFTFACCDGSLESNPLGCVIDWHREKTTEKPSKRARAF